MSSETSSAPKTAAIEELKAFIKTQRDGRQVKKALAVKLLYQEHTYESIVSILDVSMGFIAKWKQAYEAEGLSSFPPQHKGRQSYLTQAQKDAVIEWLGTKDIWTLNELEYHLASEYGVSYESKQSYYNLFESAGLSWKKTRKVNPKKDAALVAQKKLISNGYWHAIAPRLNAAT
ncbi:MAG: transposase [Leptolyngbyaceae cyanobacterium MAG.088]|nr:transposase [Leptolyngbyaceae cyanobacterium MAG.088]